MSVRLVITVHAQPGKGGELAQVMQDYCQRASQEPGCEQFELFRSAHEPDKMIVLELWADQAALDAHAERNAANPPSVPAGLRASGSREDYEFDRKG
ncbi:MAG: antibiotic biosynthesis monooxygenase family protein [Acidimicrobiales bacterium]